MGTTGTIALLDAALKVIYHRYKDLTYKNRPFLGTLPKRSVYGSSNHYPIKYSNGTSGAAVFATAQANYANPKLEKWESSCMQDYALGRVDGKLARAGAAAGSVEGVADAVQLAADAILAHLSNSIAKRCFRSQSGWLAQVASVTTGTPGYITLARIAEAANFEVGMVCVAGAPASAAYDVGSAMTTIRATFMTGPLTTGVVTGVNRSTGVITFTNIDAGTTVAQYDYLARSGDQPVATVNQCQAGLWDWCGPVAVTSAAFFGVDRTVDSRLAGSYLDASAYGSIEEALIDGCSLCGENDGQPKYIVMGWRKYASLIKELGSKATYERIQAIGMNGKQLADIGYRSVQVITNNGQVNVFPDLFCPHTFAWAYDPDDFVLESLGDLVGFDQFDNRSFWRQRPDADEYEARGISYPQMVVQSPGTHCCIKLP